MFLRVLAVAAFAVSQCHEPKSTSWAPTKISPQSERTEVEVGRAQYKPLLQMQGGTFDRYKEINTYVENIGRKVALASGRPNLPYEFEVINHSVPNAWSLPGGKVAITRGLLLTLNSEAELAAVLAHEVAHVNQRHRVLQLERGLQFDVGLKAMPAAAQDHTYGDLALEKTSIGITLVTAPYSSTDEDQADEQALQILAKAGYDPREAVRALQAIYRAGETQPDLFDTHPPTQRRIDRVAELAAEYPLGGRISTDIYARTMHVLERSVPAYERLDAGYRALVKGQAERALLLADEGLAIDRGEAHLYGLKGKALVRLGKRQEALDAFARALFLNENHFDFYYQRGVLHHDSLQVDHTRRDLLTANKLLPTAEAHFILATLDEADGLAEQALSHYKIAASNERTFGIQSKVAATRIELPKHPEQYLRTQLTLDGDGYIVLRATNYSHVPIQSVELGIRVTDTETNFLYTKKDRRSILISKVLPPGQTHVQPTRIGPFTSEAQMREQVHAYIIGTSVD